MQHWADGEIRQFVRRDAASPPPKGGILFVGSSIFREWREQRNFEADLAPLPVLNRAFGGSQTSDQLDRMEHIVFPHEPRVIVYYCGSNDLNWGSPPRDVFSRFKEFSDHARARLPLVRIVYVSINRSPQKQSQWAAVDETNAIVARYCETTPRHVFVNVNTHLFDAVGKPRHDLYREDGLHFHPHAYDVFITVLKPVLESEWAKVVATTTITDELARSGGVA